MQVKSIHVEYGRTWCLDGFESAKVSLTAHADLEEGESLAEASAQLFSQVKEQVAAQSVAMLAARNERRRLATREVLDGLPKSLREAAEKFIQAAHPDPDMLVANTAQDAVSVKVGGGNHADR
jgi:adenine-specific DNA methylase